MTSSRRHRAQDASLRRVCACLINEKLIESKFRPGGLVLSHPSTDQVIMVELPRAPMLPGLLHSSEIGPVVMHTGERIKDGASLLRIIGRWASLDVENFCLHIENSVDNQEIAYSEPQLTIDSTPIEWEQGLQEGLSMHPLYKCRYPVVADFRTVLLHFVVVDQSQVNVQGEYDSWISRLLPDNIEKKPNHVFIPVHGLQLANVRRAFPDAQVLPITIEARPEISMRTVTVPVSDIVLKLPVGIKISTTIRTIDPLEVMMGQQVRTLLPVIEQASSRFGGSLIMTQEFAAAATGSKHLGCIIRESTEAQARRTGERVIVCATMSENIEALWGNSHHDKATLLRSYCSHFFRAVLGPVFHLGIGLEAHLQNTLVRLDPATGDIKGFVVRDLGFFMVHEPTFEAATGMRLKLEVPKPRMLAPNLETIYWFLFSPVLIGHLYMIVRALRPGLAGWCIVREELDKVIPADNLLARQIWLETADNRTFAFMKHEFFGDHPKILTPNPLYHCKQLYQPEAAS